MQKEQEQRHIYYDNDLKIEAYNLTGIVQKFPNHFHKFYVIGFIEGGSRHLWCKNQEYDLMAGDLVLFNPMDNHFCAPINGEILDYRAVNVNPDVMQRAVKEISGMNYTPYFTRNVVPGCELAQALNDVYKGIVEQAPKLEKEEAFYVLLEQVLREYSIPLDTVCMREPQDAVRQVCEFLEEHVSENVSLEEMTELVNLSRSRLLHIFTKQMGVSPYRYLQSLRIEKAKRLLERGASPAEAAGLFGFTDQSHFSRFFKEFIGLTPKQYQRIFKGNEQPNDAGAMEEESYGC